MTDSRASTPGRQLVHTAGGMIAFQCMNVLSGWWVARTLGAEGQGRFQLIVAVSVFLGMLGKFGLDEGIAYRIPILRRETPGRVGPVIGYGMAWALVSGLLLAGLLVFGIGPRIAVDRLPHLAGDLRWTWLTLPALMALQCAAAALRGLERADRRAVAYYWAVGGAYLALLAALTIGGGNLTRVFTARIASYAIGLGLAWAWLRAETTGLKVEREALGEERGRLHRFAGWLLFATWFRYLVQQPLVDLAWVSGTSGAAAAGVYSVAARLASLIGLATAALTIVVGPLYAGWIAARSRDAILPMHEAAGRSIAHLSTLAAGILWWAPEPWLAIFGAEYVDGAPVLRAIAAGYALQSWAGPSSPWLLARGLSRVEGLWTGVSALWMIVGGGWAAWRYGPTGVAVVTASAVACLGWGLAFSLARREGTRPWRWCAGPAGALLIAIVPAALLPSATSPWMRAVAFGLLYTALAIRPTIRDLRFVLAAKRAAQGSVG